MQVNSQTIYDTFQTISPISVPLYQRPYCWESAEVDTLIKDIQGVLEGDEPNHFLGSLVFEKRQSEYFLVDGQQRVTTLFLLLRALTATHMSKAPVECTFKPSDEDSRTYEDIMCGELRKDDTSNMSKRFLQICSVLSEYNEEELEAFANTLLNGLYIVNIVVEENENAYAIFESLNSKGRMLEPFDLIRNFILMKLPEHQRVSCYRNYIKPLEGITKTVLKNKRINQRDVVDEIKEPYVESFIRNYLMLSGSYVAERDVYMSFKRAYDEYEGDEPGKTTGFLRELCEYAKYFVKIINPSAESDKNLQNQLSRLLMLDTETHYPLALSIYVQYAREDISINTAIELFEILETFVMRTLIGNPQAKKSLDKLFPPIGGKLFDSKHEELPRLMRNLLVTASTKNKRAYITNDNEFAESIRLFPFYGGSSQLCRLALHTLESLLGTSERVSADYTQIEHIMPQSPKDDWQQYLGESWEQVHNVYLNTIGNLTYLPSYTNVKVSNNMFEFKRSHYIKSKFALNEYFRDINDWREEDIVARGKALSRMLSKIWTAFTDVDEASLNKNKERVADKTITSFAISGHKIEVPGGEGSALMQMLYIRLQREHTELFERVITGQKDLIGTKQTGTGKFRSVKPLDSEYVVGVSTSLDQKLKDIGRTLQIMELPMNSFEAYTSDGEVLLAATPGGLRGTSLGLPANITVHDKQLNLSNVTRWAGIYAGILDVLLDGYEDKLNLIDERLLSPNGEGMRSSCKVDIAGKTHFVDTHSSTGQKKKNLAKICEVLGIDKTAIIIDGESV